MKVVRTAHLIVLLLAAQWARAERVLTDDLGRRVNLLDHPHRLVALVPSVTELITIAGADWVSADVAEDWTQMSIEAMVNKRPAVLILPSSWQ